MSTQKPLAPCWTDAAALSLLQRTGSAGLIGFWRVNLDTDEVQWDPAMFSLFGVQEGGRPSHFDELLDRYHPDDRVSVGRAYVRVLETGQPMGVRYRLMHHTGGQRQIFSRAWLSPRDESGQRWVEGFAIDVSGAFEDEALLESERKYRFVAENTREMIVRLSPDGVIEFASGASRTLLGYKPAELVGRRPREFIHPDDRERILSVVYGAAERREQPPCPLEYRMLRKDGSVAWLEAGPRLIFDPTGAIVGWMDVVRDIGVRKEIEAAAAAEHAARVRAEHADRAKTQFLSTVSHELRTPLNAIIGYAELLQEEGGSTVAADAERIRRAGRHLLDLINQILDMGKIEAGMMEAHPSEIDLRALLEEVCDTVEPLATRNGNVIELRIGPHVGEARTDGRLLKQCLLNLASNACKFTENGRVRIEAEVRPTPGGLALACEVADTGVGIPPEVAERLFQPFVQADPSTTRKFGGTGLGLALTRRFAQLLGGDVTLTSEPGRGSVFTLTAMAEPVSRAA